MLWVSAATRRHVVRWFGARDTLQAAEEHMAGRPAGTRLNNAFLKITYYF
jgi:hypothetical protein